MTGPDRQESGAAPNGTQSELERLLATARSAEERGDLAAAISALEAAPAAAQRSGIYHYALGALRARAGDLEAAISALEHAVEIEPEIPEYLGNLGAALLEAAHRRQPSGRPELVDPTRLRRALELLDTAAAAAPKLPEVHGNRALAQLLDGRAAEALLSCEAALELSTDHLPALYTKAIALHELGRIDECVAALDACLEVEPSFEPALRSREQLRG